MSLTSQERQRSVREGKVLTLARPRGPPSLSHPVPAAARSAPRFKGWMGPEVAQPSDFHTAPIRGCSGRGDVAFAFKWRFGSL